MEFNFDLFCSSDNCSLSAVSYVDQTSGVYHGDVVVKEISLEESTPTTIAGVEMSMDLLVLLPLSSYDANLDLLYSSADAVPLAVLHMDHMYAADPDIVVVAETLVKESTLTTMAGEKM